MNLIELNIAKQVLLEEYHNILNSTINGFESNLTFEQKEKRKNLWNKYKNIKSKMLEISENIK